MISYVQYPIEELFQTVAQKVWEIKIVYQISAWMLVL